MPGLLTRALVHDLGRSRRTHGGSSPNSYSLAKPMNRSANYPISRAPLILAPLFQRGVGGVNEEKPLLHPGP